jgi:carboxypeptidase Taq
VDAPYDELKRRLCEIQDLEKAHELLYWDQVVMMPPAGAAVRGDVRATVARLAHEKSVDDEIGRLLEQIEPEAEALPYDSDEASLVRVARRDWEKARKVPTELAAETAKVTADAEDAWAAARQASDFAAFKPWLDRVVELKRRYIECFAPYDDPYDPLLDDFEPGMKTAEVRVVFDRLKQELVPLIAHAANNEQDEFMRGPFAVERQHDLSLELIGRFGFEPVAYRLDTTVHPFCSSLSTQDIRLTTRYSEEELTSLFTAMHECGHGLYEHGISPALERTPLCDGASSALHESQSRLWENVVGRSRPFWRWFFPTVQRAFPDVLGDVEADAFYRAVNRVHPSFIRVDADEATYGLHIIMRFELEQELIAGTLSTADLPEAWNARVEEYLGLEVPDDGLGVLQDVHWSSGGFGYFPTYQLGNVISLQIWERAREALGDVDAQLERGEFGELHQWLRANVYAHGRKYLPAELLERVVGGPLDPAPYLRYLKSKFGTAVAA